MTHKAMPPTLSTEAFRRASNFIKLLGRPLERAIFGHEFEDGAPQAVVDALSEFQNGDGGFGHGIEPDFWMPESSPLATTVALQHISALKLPAGHPLVTGAIAYLIDSYDDRRAGWSKVSWEVEDAPHAPWWNYSPKLDGPFDPGEWGNPSAEIVGYLHEYRSLVPQKFLDETTALALDNFAALPPEIEMHVLLCCLRMYERLDSSPDGTPTQETQDRLIAASQSVISTDPASWKSYHAPPTWLAPHPGSLLEDGLRSTVEPYLDYLIETQGSIGSWEPFWSWGEGYAHAWEAAKRQWAGHLTITNLKVLRAYGRWESF